MRYNQLMVLYASVYHMIWGVLIILYGRQLLFTASVSLTKLIPAYQLRGIILILVAVIAMSAGFFKGKILTQLLMLLPQQTILLLSAFSVVSAIGAGHFGDGVPRPWEFILLDQLPILITAIMYTIAVLEPGIRATIYRRKILQNRV